MNRRKFLLCAAAVPVVGVAVAEALKHQTLTVPARTAMSWDADCYSSSVYMDSSSVYMDSSYPGLSVSPREPAYGGSVGVGDEHVVTYDGEHLRHYVNGWIVRIDHVGSEWWRPLPGGQFYGFKGLQYLPVPA